MRLGIVLALLQLPVMIEGTSARIVLRAEIPAGSPAAEEVCFVLPALEAELGCAEGPFDPGDVAVLQLPVQDHLGLLTGAPEIRALARNAEGTSPLSADAYKFQLRVPSCAPGGADGEGEA